MTGQAANAERYQEFIKSLLFLLSSFAEDNKDIHPIVAKTATEALKKVRAFSNRLEANPFVAGFIGLSNVGKSTLLNGLFGMDVAPRKNKPMTSAPVEYRYGDHFKVLVEYANTYERTQQECQDAANLITCIEKYATEEGIHDSSRINKVSAYIPADVLSGGLVIADTPGFGAAQVGEDAGTHESIVVDFLPHIHQLFWIVLFEQGITSREADFYNHHLKGKCSDIIVTGSENVTTSDQGRFKKLFEKELGLTFMTYYFLSGKEAWMGRREGDADKIKNSGILPLEIRLHEMSSLSARLPCLRLDVIKLIQDLGAYIKKSKMENSDIKWRPTVLNRVYGEARLLDISSQGEFSQSVLEALTI